MSKNLGNATENTLYLFNNQSTNIMADENNAPSFISSRIALLPLVSPKETSQNPVDHSEKERTICSYHNQKVHINAPCVTIFAIASTDKFHCPPRAQR